MTIGPYFVLSVILGYICGIIYAKYRIRRMKKPHKVIAEVLGEKAAKEFALWAFGKDFDNVWCGELMDRWNILHGKKYQLRENGSLQYDIPNMVSLWMKETGRVLDV